MHAQVNGEEATAQEKHGKDQDHAHFDAHVLEMHANGEAIRQVTGSVSFGLRERGSRDGSNECFGVSGSW